MKSKHVFLNLFVIKFPITAIMSIIHRITGLYLFICLPIFLYFLKLALESESSFLLLKELLNLTYVKLFIFSFLMSFIYHFIIGMKHIIMDIGFFDDKSSSNKLSIISLFLVIFLIFLSVFI